MIELIGFIATTIICISFIPKNVKIIRWLNLIGSIFFIIYGFTIGAFWTGFMNICIIFIQLYHLLFSKEVLMDKETKDIIKGIKQSIKDENVSYEELIWLSNHKDVVKNTNGIELAQWAGISEKEWNHGKRTK